MDKDKIIETLRLKHVILCGGSESARRTQIEAISKGFMNDDTDVFRLPPGIGTSDEFIATARRTFPIKPLLKDQTVEEMSHDQVNDVLLDWAEDSKRSTLIIWEEIGSLEPRDDLYEFLNAFVTSKYILEEYFRSGLQLRLLASSRMDLGDYFESGRLCFGRDQDDPITNDQIVRNSLEIIDMSS
jgi:hypothetical protein